MPRPPRPIKLFSEALRAAAPEAITIPGMKPSIVGYRGEMVYNTHRYEEHEEFGLEHEYRFDIPKHPELKVTVDLRLDGGVYWRLFAYSRIKGKPTPGMLFSINLTHRQDDPKLLTLAQRLKSSTRGVESPDRSRDIQSMTERLLTIGLVVDEGRVINFGFFETHSGKFIGTSAAQFVRDFVVTAVVKGHYMRNKGYELPGLDGIAPPPRSIGDSDTRPAFDPDNWEDARQRARADVVRRPGQSAFRDAVLKAYGGHCAVTDCDFPGTMAAAHIVPHLGEHTDHVQNGLFLRADIHVLFDRGLLGVDVTTMKVLLAPALRSTVYRTLEGADLTVPKDPGAHPNKQALDDHRRKAGL